jgi:large subunit ribosomal protein L31e
MSSKEEKRSHVTEGLYVINLSRVYWSGRRRRAPRAIRIIRDFIQRHTKADRVVIDSSINEYIFSRRYDKPPRRVAVMISRVSSEPLVVKASLAVPIKQESAGKEESGEG